MRLGIAVLVVAALLSSLLPAPTGAADPACGPGQNGHVWFVGAVYDAAGDPPREDFQLDVDNFELFLDTLRSVYCIPDDQARILAFHSNYARNGKTYPAASEAALKDTLADFGAAASQHDDAILFLFLSSHGFVSAATGCTGGSRAIGSYAQLGGGNLLDCELGRELTDHFDPDVRMAVFVDCSFCGGFSDSLTALSGTAPDGGVPVSSGVPGPNRIVVTGCAVTTECFGSSGGAVLYSHMARVLGQDPSFADGMAAPGFPQLQGVNVPARVGLVDGATSVSELFFAAVLSVYARADAIGIQEQFRIKYGFDNLQDDLAFAKA